MNNSRLSLTLCALLASMTYMSSEAQVTRSQVYTQFMRANMLLRNGQDSAAIAALDKVADLVPELPLTYLREARIYDDMYEHTAKTEALNGAVLMYRKYLSLEINPAKTMEASDRLRILEDKMQIAHFEDQEAKDSQEELAAEDAIQVITDDKAAEVLTASVTEQVIEEIPVLELKKPDFSYLKFYNISIPTTPVVASAKQNNLETIDMKGHWVSDISNANGRELWMIDLQQLSKELYNITFSNESGIVHTAEENETFFRRALTTAKTYMRKYQFMSTTSYEVVRERTTARVEPGNILVFTFDIDEEYQPGKKVYKWMKNLSSNIASLLPFGSMVSNYLNNYATNREELDKERTFTTSYTFRCQPVSNKLMNCTISSVKKSTNKNGRARETVGQEITCHFFQAEPDYAKKYEKEETYSKENGTWEKLFDQVKADAQRNVNYNYPLALLYYYGVGVKKNENKAINCMNLLATIPTDYRAKTWLASFFYDAAYNKDEYSTATRRKFLESAGYWSKSLHDRKQKEWYGLRGDQCLSDFSREVGNTVLADSAFYFFTAGDAAGDIYSTYRLGYMKLHDEYGKPNLEEAEKYLVKASQAGNADAIYELACLCLKRKDLKGYLTHLSMAADRGCPESYAELCDAYQQGPDRGLELNFEQASKMRKLSRYAEADEWIPTLLSFGYKMDNYFK